MSENELMRQIGKNIQDNMDYWNMTQRELSEETNISKSTISRYITGDSLPSLKNIINIAVALECNIDELIPYEHIV